MNLDWKNYHHYLHSKKHPSRECRYLPHPPSTSCAPEGVTALFMKVALILQCISLKCSKFLQMNLERALCFWIFEKMQAILLYWFAAQQQTSKLRRQKFFMWNLVQNLMKLFLSSKNDRDWPKKWLELKKKQKQKRIYMAFGN